MSSELDFVYKNPPLVEVIAEVRWKLLPGSTFARAALGQFLMFWTDVQ